LSKFTKFSNFSVLYGTYCTAVYACVLFQFPAVTCPVTLEKRYHGILSAKLVNFMEVCVCVLSKINWKWQWTAVAEEEATITFCPRSVSYVATECRRC